MRGGYSCGVSTGLGSEVEICLCPCQQGSILDYQRSIARSVEGYLTTSATMAVLNCANEIEYGEEGKKKGT